MKAKATVKPVVFLCPVCSITFATMSIYFLGVIWLIYAGYVRTFYRQTEPPMFTVIPLALLPVPIIATAVYLVMALI